MEWQPIELNWTACYSLIWIALNYIERHGMETHWTELNCMLGPYLNCVELHRIALNCIELHWISRAWPISFLYFLPHRTNNLFSYTMSYHYMGTVSIFTHPTRRAPIVATRSSTIRVSILLARKSLPTHVSRYCARVRSCVTPPLASVPLCVHRYGNTNERGTVDCSAGLSTTLTCTAERPLFFAF
jgi:hypothetical protein